MKKSIGTISGRGAANVLFAYRLLAVYGYEAGKGYIRIVMGESESTMEEVGELAIACLYGTSSKGSIGKGRIE